MADASGYRPRGTAGNFFYCQGSHIFPVIQPVLRLLKTRGTVPLCETVPVPGPAIYFIVKVLIFPGNSAGFAFAENREDSSALRNRPRSSRGLVSANGLQVSDGKGNSK